MANSLCGGLEHTHKFSEQAVRLLQFALYAVEAFVSGVIFKLYDVFCIHKKIRKAASQPCFWMLSRGANLIKFRTVRLAALRSRSL